MSDEILRAAQARAARTARPGDRPQDRRSALGYGAPAAMSTGARILATRAAVGEAGASTAVSGYASITETPYMMMDIFGPYNEIVSTGAFMKTLSTSPEVEFTVNHGSGGSLPLAHTRNGTLFLSEDDTGLAFAATVDPERTDVSNLLLALARGDMAEASFKFRIDSGMWSPDYSEFRITSVDLARGDVSAVNFGANPAAYTALRSAASLSRALDPADVNQITQALALFAAIDLIVDQAQESLAAYLGVPNPDDDDETGEPLQELPAAPAMTLLQLLAL